jgi:hypothetical protein
VPSPIPPNASDDGAVAIHENSRTDLFDLRVPIMRMAVNVLGSIGVHWCSPFHEIWAVAMVVAVQESTVSS